LPHPALLYYPGTEAKPWVQISLFLSALRQLIKGNVFINFELIQGVEYIAPGIYKP